MTDIPFERPALRCDLGARDVKMTYGLEMDLRRLMPDAPTAIALVMRDPYTQDYIIRRCLTDAKKIITKDEDLIAVNEVDLTSDEVEKLLMWATEHVLYFFVTRAKSMEKVAARYQTALPTPSEIGSENSASTTPSAGPTE